MKITPSLHQLLVSQITSSIHNATNGAEFFKKEIQAQTARIPT